MERKNNVDFIHAKSKDSPSNGLHLFGREAAHNGIGYSDSRGNVVRAQKTQGSVISGHSPFITLFFGLVKRGVNRKHT
ncbi:MAG: hypothetical protein MRJ67_10710, partial [Nitrospirales bacterium]|nr:hypothetical protein [Nitrospirales bacterium]